MWFAKTAIAIWVGALYATGQSFIDQKDRDLASKANTKALESCALAVDPDIDAEERAKRKEDLVKASADNIILKILKDSTSPDDLTVQMQDQALNPSFLLFQAGPLLAFIFFLVVYVLYFCWAPLPCCWCCSRKRNCPMVLKFVFIVLIGGIILGLIIAAALSMRGFDSAVNGFENTQCTAARLVNSTMAGNSDPKFLGVIRTLEIFQELKDSLNTGSSFLNSLTAILTNTKPISDSVLVASETMTNIQLMLSDSANVNPMNSGTDLLHKCEMCAILATPIQDAVSALNAGVGSALASTRNTVEEQLTGPNLQTLSDSMLSGADPLIELKSVVHSAFGPFVEQDTLATVSDGLATGGTLSSVALIGVALLLAACSILTGVCWICVDKSKDTDGTSQHRRVTHRCACCTWCCGCFYMLFVLLISGIMTAAAIPLSSMCLLLEDVDGQTITDISAPLELNLTGATGDMMISMIEECFRNPDPNANPLLLNLIKVDNGTMYELIVNQTRDQINAQFDSLTALLDTGDLALYTVGSPIYTLTQTLRNTPMSSMILPEQSKLTSAAATYGAMLNDGALQGYVMSGAGCSDMNVPNTASYGSLAGETIYGINTFGAAIRARFAPDVSSSVCATGKVLCTGETGTEAAVCTASNAFMDLKVGLRPVGSSIFKCRRFTKNGMPCNPGTQNCLVNGAMVPETYDCTVDQFQDLLSTYYGQALEDIFTDLDTKTSTLKDQISTNLKALVDQQVMQKISTVADGMTCGFLGASYQGVIDGLCYGGVWGFQAMSASYVACAVLTILLVIITFIVWRVAYDNVLSNTPVVKLTTE